MACILTPDDLADLPRGAPVWEEWRYGTNAQEMIKTRTKYNAKGGRLIYGRYTGQHGQITFTDDPDFRYWDAEPTQEERRMTPWP